MKKLITTFGLICFLVIGAFAQGNFILNGNVIDTNGNPVSNHQVCIFTDSMQTSLVIRSQEQFIHNLVIKFNVIN